MEKFVSVIDYGLGNLRSVSKALERAGVKVRVSSSPKEVAQASAIVLPGVGAFKQAMDNLHKFGLAEAITAAVKQGVPFLGICLGLQVLFTESEEYGMCSGFGIIPGRVIRFAAGVKIPHMGWNAVKQAPGRKPQAASSSLQPAACSLQLFRGIPDESYFYFVHSYYVKPEDKNVIAATTEYGQEFVCAVNKDNVWGVQFHPEKSAELGLQILRNFVRCVC